MSISVKLKADYVSRDSLQVVESFIGASPLVDEVSCQTSLVEALNANLSKISAVIGVFIALMLFISFVLINNTMRLSKSFIRGPFLVRAAFLGLFSAVVALMLLVGVLFYVRSEFSQLFTIFTLDKLLVVMLIVIASGLVICLLSTYMVVNKLVSLSKDELYY